MRDEPRAGATACPPDLLHRYCPQLVANGRRLPHEIWNAGAERRSCVARIHRPDKVVACRPKAAAKQSSRDQRLSVHERRLDAHGYRATRGGLHFFPCGDGTNRVRQQVDGTERVERITQHLCAGGVARGRARRRAADEKAASHARSWAGVIVAIAGGAAYRPNDASALTTPLAVAP